MNNKFSSYFLIGLALGLGIGFGAGVFQAPDSGERTRRKFLKKAERLKQSMVKTAGKSAQHAKV